MFIIQNGKITSDKTLDIGKIRIINLVFKSDLAFADDDKFKLVLGDIQSENFAFENDGCLRFSYVDVSEIIKKENTDLSVKVTCNGSQILADSITITAYVQGGGSGEEIQGIVLTKAPYYTTEIKMIPQDFTKDLTDFSWLFSNYQSLTAMPWIDTSNGTNFKRMFYNCLKLTTIQQIDTSNGTDFESMFYECRKINNIPPLDTSNGTNFYNMFSYCRNLTTIPPLDTSNGTNFNTMFGQSNMITTIPPLDVSKGTDFGYMFWNCTQLKNFGGLLNVKKSYSLAESRYLTHQSLLNVLNGLYDLTGSTSQTLTLGSTNLAKLTDEEKAIATNKNWVLA